MNIFLSLLVLFLGIVSSAIGSGARGGWVRLEPPITVAHYADGVFMSGGSSGMVFTSTNGSDWIPRGSVGGVDGHVRAISYNDGIWYVLGSDGLFQSEDGESWEKMPLERYLSAFEAGNGCFVGLSGGDTFLVSTDGKNWDAHKLPPGEYVGSGRIVFINGRFVAVGGNWIGVSFNGIDWQRAAVLGPTVSAVAAAYGNGNYVVVGEKGVILQSLDAHHWNVIAQGASYDFQDVAFADGKFLAVASNGTVHESFNAVDWQEIEVANNTPLYAVVHGNGVWVISGYERTNFVSTDGIRWRATSPESAYTNAVAAGPGGFVAVGPAGIVLRSRDGRKWEQFHAGTMDSLRSVIFAKGEFLALGRNGNYFTSPDGVTWVSRTFSLIVPFLIEYGSGIYVTLSTNGSVSLSTDGRSWEPYAAQISIGGSPTVLRFVHDRFILLGSFGEVWSTIDGRNWILDQQLKGELTSVTYGDGLFVIVGRFGKFWTSSDGRSWTEYSAGSEHFYDICFANNRFYAIGSDGSATWTGEGEWEYHHVGFAHSPGVRLANNSTGRVIFIGEHSIAGYWKEFLGGFQQWREDFFLENERDVDSISGPQASPAGDGVSNIVKYMFGLPPKDYRSIGFNGLISVKQSEENAHAVEVGFNRFRGSSDISYHLRSSRDLDGPWNPTSAELEVVHRGIRRESVRFVDHPEEVNQRMYVITAEIQADDR